MRSYVVVVRAPFPPFSCFLSRPQGLLLFRAVLVPLLFPRRAELFRANFVSSPSFNVLVLTASSPPTERDR